jgi:hypothetical protein
MSESEDAISDASESSSQIPDPTISQYITIMTPFSEEVLSRVRWGR